MTIDWWLVLHTGIFITAIIAFYVREERLTNDLRHWQLVASSLATRLEDMGAEVIIDREGGGSGVTILWPDPNGGIAHEGKTQAVDNKPSSV